ncbi:hypothetical protein [Ramlibacter sp. AN1133]|uniref:hypothetical protein n=1 Tax=Ramlibacter sp. AN1133 TaxID=3133429 RepID=UPI0030BD06BA
MPITLARSLLDAVLASELGSSEPDAGNRFSLDGLTLGPATEGGREIGIRRFEATSLRLAAGALALEVGRLALYKLVGQVRTDAGRPRLSGLRAANAELSGVKAQGLLMLPTPATGGLHAPPAPAGAQAATATPTTEIAGSPWSLGPLAGAEGSLQAKIVDAQLLFDADVTVPMRQGQIDFNDASVEHVGPDSRMGVSRMGLYVDAPNGRSYLYQFPATPVGGVEYERRGALLGPFVSDRGKLRLREFAEGLLRQSRAGLALGFTEQARLLFGRTALRGDLQLGDGTFCAPGVRAEMAGRAEGRNAVRVHSEAVGRGLTLEIPSLSLRHAVLTGRGTHLECDEVTGSLTLRLFIDNAQPRFAFELANAQVTGLRL